MYRVSPSTMDPASARFQSLCLSHDLLDIHEEQLSQPFLPRVSEKVRQWRWRLSWSHFLQFPMPLGLGANFQSIAQSILAECMATDAQPDNSDSFRYGVLHFMRCKLIVIVGASLMPRATI